MPHHCVRCSRVYEDGSKVVLTGCQCGGRFFFFVKKKEDLAVVEKLTADLTSQQKLDIEHTVKEQIHDLEVSMTTEEKAEAERDALEMVGDEEDENPIVLDLESVRVLKPGTFGLNLPRIFQKQPLIYRLEEGKYVLDIASVFDAGKSADKLLGARGDQESRSKT